jgi:fructose-1,6-bisphosphatase/inositol monophosphatase family enzyme
VSVKGRGNLVTETDVDIERLIQEILDREYPDHGVLSEETAGLESRDSELEAREWLWVVDPLDGTRNYVSGIPFFCVNVALCHHGEPVVAVTHDPCHGETFWAEKGGGAFVNAEPIRASDKPSVRASVVGVDLGYDDWRAARMLELVADIWPGMQSVRIPGSAALGLAYAACGRYDLFAHHNLFPWDVAAGILLVREAGGAITDRDGGPASIYSEGVVAGGKDAHADLLRLAAGRPWRDDGASSK